VCIICAVYCVAARLQLDCRKHLCSSPDDLLELVELRCSTPLLPRRRPCRRVASVSCVLLRVIGREWLALRQRHRRAGTQLKRHARAGARTPRPSQRALGGLKTDGSQQLPISGQTAPITKRPITKRPQLQTGLLAITSRTAPKTRRDSLRPAWAPTCRRRRARVRRAPRSSWRASPARLRASGQGQGQG